MNLAQAKKLKDEAGKLYDILSRDFLSRAIPQSRANPFTNGDEQPRRLGRLAQKAHRRFERRRDIYNSIKWPKAS